MLFDPNATYDSTYQSFFQTMKRIGLPLDSCKAGKHSLDYFEYIFIFLIKKPLTFYSSYEKYIAASTSSIGGLEIVDTDVIDEHKGKICVRMTRNGYISSYGNNASNCKKTNSYDSNCETMSGIDFENYLFDLLSSQGFYVEITKASGDQGVDLLVRYGNHLIAIQCKRYNSSVGNQAVQEVFAGSKYYGADIPVVISNSSFTRSAIELAESCGVFLIGRDEMKTFLDNPREYLLSITKKY